MEVKKECSQRDSTKGSWASLLRFSVLRRPSWYKRFLMLVKPIIIKAWPMEFTFCCRPK